MNPTKPPPLTRASSKNIRVSETIIVTSPPDPAASPEKTSNKSLLLTESDQPTILNLNSPPDSTIETINNKILLPNNKTLIRRRSSSQDLQQQLHHQQPIIPKLNRFNSNEAAVNLSLAPPSSSTSTENNNNLTSVVVNNNTTTASNNKNSPPNNNNNNPSSSSTTTRFSLNINNTTNNTLPSINNNNNQQQQSVVSTSSSTTTTVASSSSSTTPGLERLRIDNEIGRGSCSQVIVFKARAKHELSWVALKRVGKIPTSTPTTADNNNNNANPSPAQDALKKVINEVRCLHKLKHNRIVGFINWYETKRSVWVVLEHIAGGTLEEILIRCGPFNPCTTAWLALDIGDALQYLHDTVGMVHGNLIPRSVLMTENGVAKLSGFSRARFINENPNNSNNNTYNNNTNKQNSTMLVTQSSSSSTTSSITSPNTTNNIQTTTTTNTTQQNQQHPSSQDEPDNSFDIDENHHHHHQQHDSPPTVTLPNPNNTTTTTTTTTNNTDNDEDEDDLYNNDDPILFHDPLLRFKKLSYAPPEFFQQWADGVVAPQIIPETDMWALGCLLHEASLCKVPFSSTSSFFTLSESVREDEPKYPIHLKTFPSEYWQLLSELLCKNPLSRIKAKQVKDHSFMIQMLKNNTTTVLGNR
jgi:serine/threonine protein kinase